MPSLFMSDAKKNERRLLKMFQGGQTILSNQEEEKMPTVFGT